jgi:hypothetical protein
LLTGARHAAGPVDRIEDGQRSEVHYFESCLCESVPRVDPAGCVADHAPMKRFSLIFVALLPVVIHAQARLQSPAHEHPAMKTFLENPEHCVYMATLPENEDPSQLRSFERDLAAALQALRATEGALSEVEALSRLRAMCDEAISNQP